MVNGKIEHLESIAAKRSKLLIPVVLMLLTLAMFARVLFVSGDRVLSQLGQDLSDEFVYWRQFGFQQLREGHLALWNPHVFCGVPFFGGFQAALLYPPNLIYLLLPLAKAINFEIALHVFLLGWFMSMWLRHYRLGWASLLFGSVSIMFGGAFFLHIFPGHLATLDAMAWTPLILLTVDELVENPRPAWVFIGIFVFAMELLAGHPQTLFNILVTCGLYGLFRVREAPFLRRTILSLAIVGVGAIAITAVQLWAGIQATGEGTRAGGVGFGFAAALSFPPRNFLTLLVPGFFGNLTAFPYWGPGYLWEMCPFFGLTGLTMAVLALCGRSPRRLRWGVMAILLLWIALGDNTPLLYLLYCYVPGFDHFRCHAKFIFDAALFLVMLAATGVDELTHSARGVTAAAAVLFVSALVIGTFGIWLRYDPSLGGIVPSPERSETQRDTSTDPIQRVSFRRVQWDSPKAEEFTAAAAGFAENRCLQSSVILLVLAGLLLLRRSHPKGVYLIILLGIGEMFAFAHSSLITFDLSQAIPSAVQELLAKYPGDYRVLLLPNRSNSAMVIDAQDIWGYDPMVLDRYAQLIAYSQGENTIEVSTNVTFVHFGQLLDLARLHLIVLPGKTQNEVVERAGALPHLLLVNQWTRLTGTDHILAALRSKSFDPTKTIILETDPDIQPQSGPASGTAKILQSDSDSMTISAQVPTPAVLLISDCYSRYWTAEPLPHSDQQRYEVLPANYTFMAVPLAAGSHVFRLAYHPSGYFVGRWVSIIALFAYLLALGIFVGRRRTARHL